MPMRCSVTISLVPEVRGGPFVFWGDLPGSIRQAAALGFHGVEIFPPGSNAIDVEATRRLLADSGLTLAAMGTGAGWALQKLTLTSGNHGVRQKAEEFIRGIIDSAGSLGAPAIIGSMQGRWGDGVERVTALGYLSEALNRLGEHAKSHGVPLLYEPINRYETNMICSVVEAVGFMRTLATDGVKVLGDLFHMNIEENDIAAALRAAKGYLGYVHFVDSNRRPAGMGHIDYAPIAAALKEIGYGGFLSAEALSYPDPAGAAKQTITIFRKLFSPP
jgi:sugar phosphate isomerase/epimerase